MTLIRRVGVVVLTVMMLLMTSLQSGRYYVPQAYAASQSSKVERLGAPLVTATVKGDMVQLSWKKVKKADVYRVYQYDNEMESYVRICTIKSNSRKVKNLAEGTYRFKVTAAVKHGKGYTNGYASKAVTVRVKKEDVKTDTIDTTTDITTTPATSSQTLFEEALPGTKLGISILSINKQVGKSVENHNPLITEMYCADPTSIEYNGRIYVYGTNDQQQYDYNKNAENTYGQIKSLVMMSSEDMVNWTYHGTIEVGKISPWAYASWAPSIVSREESDGKTHFYLYYSNSGAGVGVLTSTSPTGPWIDPLGKPLISRSTPGLTNCNIPFDPGVVIDDKGNGWLAFGGGDKNSTGTDAMPGNARIVKLGKNMISLDSEIVEIPAPYHFEANELNYINGTFVFSYSTSWKERSIWTDTTTKAPSACAMGYMTTKTPLEKNSWVYKGEFLKNPGQYGLGYGNNHTHIQKFKEKYYLFYHCQTLQNSRGVKGGYRNINVDELKISESTATLNMGYASNRGVSQISFVNPYNIQQAEMYSVSSDLTMVKSGDTGNMIVTNIQKGDWICVKGVDFGTGASEFAAKVNGKGRIEVRLDSINSEAVFYLEFSSNKLQSMYSKISKEITGVHNVYFVFGGNDVSFDEWQFRAK